jgi:hypothetical protein
MKPKELEQIYQESLDCSMYEHSSLKQEVISYKVCLD